MNLSLVALAVFLLNLPFGYRRAGQPKFSWRWILAIHAPVPGVVALRMASGLGFQIVSLPIMIGAFCLGPGGQVFRRWRRLAVRDTAPR